MTNNTSNVIVYLGDSFTNRSEERFLNKLRRDLGTRGVPATIFANFHARGNNGQRQVDLLVFTPHRLCQVEEKSLDPRHPVQGRINGPWKIILPDGGVRTIERNPYRQAQDATYALSDTMRTLARTGRIPAAKNFYKQIDTVVCIDPEIPAGSAIEADDYVTVTGYHGLLERLSQPGRHPDWTPEQIAALATHLELHRQEEAAPAERQRRANLELVADYARLFAERRGSNLPALVPLPFGPGSALGDVVALAAHVAKGGSAALYGPSGVGKTFIAQHVAVELSRRGQLAVWLRAGEYEAGRFGLLLARAAGPFSPAGANDLVVAATTTASGVTLILDGVNESPPALRGELIEQLGGYVLRYGCAAILTSTDPLTTPETLPAQPVNLVAPGTEERAAILASYGAAHPDKVSDAFILPYELAIAAECEAALDEHATAADLFDAYIRQVSPLEAVRQGLRYLAAALHDGLRSSMRLPEAVSVLAAVGGARLDGRTVDLVLDSRLLSIDQGHVAFRHDLLGRFLAAEAIAYAASGGESLGRALLVEHRSDLRQLALSIERDPGRRSQALNVLAQADLHLAAATGQLGTNAIEPARAAIAGALADATFSTWSQPASFEGNDYPQAAWTLPAVWEPNHHALLEAAGMALGGGLFVEEVGLLLDATDHECEKAVQALRQAGSRRPITTVIAATYSGMALNNTGQMAASVLAQACYLSHPMRHWGRDHAVASRLLAGRSQPAWGRLYLACLTADPHCSADAEVLPDLIARAWNSRAYHLQLEALEAAARCGRNLEPSLRAALGEVLEGFRTDNVWLQSSIVEALVACGNITTDVTSDGIGEQIAAVLAEPENPDAWAAAAGILSRQFEDQDIVGPYFETVEALGHEQRTRLLILGARHPGWMWRSWALEQLLDVQPADEDQRKALTEIFGAEADTLQFASPFLDDGIAVHVLGCRGWARLTGTERPASVEEHPGGLAWLLVDALIANLEGVPVEVDAVWDRLIAKCPETAVDALYRLSRAGMLGREGTHQRLVEAFPTQLRQILEWGLEHRGSLRSPFTIPDTDMRDSYIIRTLGAVGDANTAERLDPYRYDPALAASAINAIREIRKRTSTR